MDKDRLFLFYCNWLRWEALILTSLRSRDPSEKLWEPRPLTFHITQTL